MTAKKETERLIVFGHHMRFITKKKCAAYIHVRLRKILTENDMDLLIIGLIMMPFGAIGMTLCTEFRLIGTTEEIGTINQVRGKHLTNQQMIGTRFTGLNICSKQLIVNVCFHKDIQ